MKTKGNVNDISNDSIYRMFDPQGYPGKIDFVNVISL